MDFSSTYPKLRVTCPSFGQHNLAVSWTSGMPPGHENGKIISNQQIEGFSPKKNQAPKPPHPWKWSSGWSSHFFHRSPGLPISPSHCVVHRPQHFQGDHPAVLHTNQAISTPAFNMSWPFCTVRVVFLGQMLQLPLHLRVQTDQEMGMWALEKQQKMEVL